MRCAISLHPTVIAQPYRHKAISSNHPKILVLARMPFNTQEGTGIALSALFNGWPKGHIAQLCGESAIMLADRIICDSYYGLGMEELRRVWPLRLISALRGNPAAGGGGVAPLGGVGRSGIAAELRRYLHERGWLYPVDACLSDGLKRFLDDFSPDLVFAAPAEFALVRLTRQIGRHLGVPVAVQIWDNWMAQHYRKGVGAARKRRFLDAELRALLDEAALRFGISDAMCDAYSAAYDQPFHALPVSVDVAEWYRPLAERGTPAQPFTILYAGTIHRHAAYTGLEDMSRAVEALNALGLQVRFRVLTAAPPDDELMSELGGMFTEFTSADNRAKLLAETGAADLLFLPVAFDTESHDFIKYSLPAKSAAYMASGTPILVYAPPDLPIAIEAARHGIAHAVTARDIGQLTEGVRHMLSNQAARVAISDSALGRAREAYDRPVLQERTSRLFAEAILKHGSGSVR